MKTMIKLITAILICLTALSCATYNSTIQARYTTQSPVSYDTKHLDEHNKPIPIYDSIYVVSPTWKQAYSWSDKPLFWGSSVVVASSLIGSGIVPGGAFPIFALSGAYAIGSSLEWYRWNSDKEISKSQYDSLIKVDGNLGAFWKTAK
jgi:hypothetical protein